MPAEIEGVAAALRAWKDHGEFFGKVERPLVRLTTTRTRKGGAIGDRHCYV